VGDPSELHPTTWRMLRALRAGVRISRNRHYALFEDQHVRRAVELHRYLRSIVADVRRHADALTVEPVTSQERGAHALRLNFEHMNGSRVAYLTDLELELLAEEAPEVARLLAGAIRSPASDGDS
jgi:hypothetical protein